jgi:hypothetical protein
MGYYTAKVNFQSVETKRNGDPVMIKSEFLVAAESVLEVETKVAEFLKGTTGFFETIQISKSKVEAVID